MQLTRRSFLKSAPAAVAASSAVRSQPASHSLKVLGLLTHITHYDPKWVPRKPEEGPFSLETGIRILEAMQKNGLNTIVVDIADGVIYESHPELQRHYSVPIGQLARFAGAAHDHGIDFVPKLNFAKSGRNLHDMWMKPHWSQRNFLRGRNEYWRVAGELIDELVSVCSPQHYFHIGMDEDHLRSVNQFVDAIQILTDKISAHNLRPVMWNDTCYENRNVIAQVHADKCRAAEPRIPKSVIQVLWDYDLVHHGIIERLAREEFDVWVAPGRDSGMIQQWKDLLSSEGGPHGQGLLMSNWRKCNEENEPETINMINTFGPDFRAR